MRSDTVRSLLRLALLTLVFYLLQSAVFSRLRIWGAAPLLLPLVAVGAGLLGGGGWGGGAGLAAGLLCDVSLGGQGLTFTVFLTAAGFFAGFLGEFILHRGFPSYLLLSLGTLVLSAVLQMLRLWLYAHCPLWPLALTGLKQTGYSLLFTIPAYFCLRRALQPWLRARM